MEFDVFSYLVIFKSEETKYEGPISINPTGNGTMHLLDDEMYPTVDALEFLLHMPRNIFDLYDIDENIMNASHDTPHHIILVPDKLIENNQIENEENISLKNIEEKNEDTKEDSKK